MDQPYSEEEEVITNYFPDPPPFYKYFTAENQEHIRQIEKEAGANDKDSQPNITRPFGATLSVDQILALPPELRYFIPPEPPADDEEFTVFNEGTKAKGAEVFMKNMEYIRQMLKVEAVLDDWQYEQMYPSAATQTSSQPDSSSTVATLDRQNYLLRFIRSIMLSYITLLGVMASDATSPLKDEKLRDILNMVANMHSLINEYRPHQARESLIRKMENQVERKRNEIECVRKMSDKVRDVLEGFGQDAEGIQKRIEGIVQEDMIPAGEDGKRQESQRRMWQALDELL